jgi:hypothetical protein
MQKNDHRTVGGPGFGVSNIEGASIDLLQGAEGFVRSGFIRRNIRRFCCARLCLRRTDRAELRGGNGHRGGAKETAAMLVDCLHDLDPIHGVASLFHRCVAD